MLTACKFFQFLCGYGVNHKGKMGDRLAIKSRRVT